MGPTSVTLSRDQWPLSAGRDSKMTCTASGSLPPATLTWWRDGVLLGLINQVVSQIELKTKIREDKTVLKVPTRAFRIKLRYYAKHMPKLDEQTLNCDTNIEVGYNLITDWWLYWRFQAL